MFKPRRTRGFEIAKGFEEKAINLPIRMTNHSAGYDIEAAEDIEIPSVWRGVYTMFKRLLSLKVKFYTASNTSDSSNSLMVPTRVATGIKAYMRPNEVLKIYNRSSNPIKRFLLLTNGVAVIDADHYNNPDNDGHIGIQFINFSFTPVKIKKGERIAQGVFETFLIADSKNCRQKDAERTGGEGSTNK